MTKALSKGEKTRRRRAGRPRNAEARREPSGRAQRPSVESERVTLADLASAAIRCRRAGWEDTADNRRLAAQDWRFGTLPGVLNASRGADKRPRLSARALAGLMQYATVREAWRKAEGFPSEWPGIASYCDVRGGAGKDPFEPSYAAWIGGLHSRFIAAERVLVDTGRKPYVYDAFTAGEDVKAADVASWIVEELEAAGEALAVHFGL